MEFGGFPFSDDEQPEEEPTWSIPGLDKIYARVELATIALDIEDVVAHEEQNLLTISFKAPLRAFAQKSQNKHGEITFQELDPSKVESQAAADSQTLLGRELLGIVPRTMKMNLYFEGAWDDQNMLGGASEGKTCLEELKTYLAILQKIREKVEKKREIVASFQKRQDEQKSRKFCDLSSDSYARKAVEEFDLDITKTGCWDSAALEEEWKAWYDLRKKAEAELPESHTNLEKGKEAEEEDEEEEEEEDEFDEDDEDFFESPQFRGKMLKELRKDYAEALKAGGCSTAKAQAAAKGLYINDVTVVEDGGIAPRTCSISVRIFSAVGKARLVDLEHEHHARARSTFFEEHAHINAQVTAFDPETGAFQVVDDLAGSSDDFALFNMDRHHQTGKYTYALATAKQAQTLALAIFGQKSTKSFLSDRDAFRVFMMAAGADAHPFTAMDYNDFCPLSYLDMKFRKK